MAKLLPFEDALLARVGALLPLLERGQLAEQVACINSVQRLLDWNEIEFYCMRWFKVHWPPAVLFQNHSEFVLASGTLLAQGSAAPIKVWAVGGHVFSIESEVSLKPFRTATDVSVLFADTAQPNRGLQPRNQPCVR